MIGMRLSLMRHVEHLRPPLPQQVAEARGKCTGCAESAVGFPPEVDILDTRNLCRDSRLRLTDPDRLFRGPSVAALLAGSEEDNAHGGSAHDMAPSRAAAPDRLV